MGKNENKPTELKKSIVKQFRDMKIITVEKLQKTKK